MIDVSVIIPVYNVGKKVQKAIDSVNNQKNVTIEIICVDDGSSDDTCEILNECKSKYDNLHVVHQKNSGAAKARNAGMQIAEGRFIAFLDADDYYLDDTAFFHMIEKCMKYNAKVCGAVMYLEENGLVHPSAAANQVLENARKGLIHYREIQGDYDFTTYIFERQMILENNIEFPTLRYFEDPPFLVRALFAAGCYVECEAALYCYVIPDKGAKLKSIEQMLDLVDGIGMNIHFAIKNNLLKLLNTSVNRLIYEYGDMIHCFIDKSTVLKEKILDIQNELETMGNYYDFERLLNRKYEDYAGYLSQCIESAQKIYIFGTGMVSKEFTKYFIHHYGVEKLRGYVVSKKKETDGDDVISLEEYAGYPCKGLLVLAVSGIFVGEIVQLLNQFEIDNYEILDTTLNLELR